MGRKPNPLIAEHFERGTKLLDNSNRYEHTCKACGQLFPKGRIESLLIHVIKKCPSLSSQHRATLLPTITANLGSQIPTNTSQTINTSTAQLTGFEDRYNPLNILAAAANNNVEISGLVAGHHMHLDPVLDDDSLASSFLNMPEDNVIPRLSDSFGSPATTVAASLSSDKDGVPSSRSTSGTLVERALHSQEPGLESIAVSASEMLHDGSEHDYSQGSITEELLLHSLNSEDSSTGLGCHSLDHSLLMQPTSQPSNPSHAPLALGNISTGPLRKLAIHSSPTKALFITESGTPARSMKPKIRGKFTLERRKEVQDMRKMGACLRCRMLKKTCSGGSPCQACASVESPRVWKKRCIRTKIVNMFTLFSVGLPSILSYHHVTAVKESTNLEPFDGYIEAFHLEYTGQAIGLKVLKSRSASQTDVNSAHISDLENSRDCFVLDIENDGGVDLRVHQYLKSAQPFIIAQEQSRHTTSTLEAAKQLLAKQYDSILERTMELWSAVSILIDPDMSFKLVARTGTPVTQQSVDQGLHLSAAAWPQSFHLINSQLRAIIDKRADKLARGLMIDLERRLMQKTNNDASHTFIASILLMNAMERMCWEFGKWNADSLLPSWPLGKPPNEYATEGDNFGVILDSLLHMRGVSPKTTVDHKTKCIVPEGEVDETIRVWFEKIAVTTDFLKVAAERPFLTDDCRSLDMKLWYRVIRLEYPGGLREKDVPSAFAMGGVEKIVVD